MVTLQSYYNVARLWHAEQQGDFNPFEGTDDFYSLQEAINGSEDAVVADDGWVDYGDNVKTFDKRDDDEERHGD